MNISNHHGCRRRTTTVITSLTLCFVIFLSHHLSLTKAPFLSTTHRRTNAGETSAAASPENRRSLAGNSPPPSTNENYVNGRWSIYAWDDATSWNACSTHASSPMGFGMQMGLGYGNVNDGSSSCRFPMVPMPQFQGTHVPVALAHTSRPASLHVMARSKPQMFGLSMSMPCAPMSMFSFPGDSLMNPSAAGLWGTVESASAPKLKDPMPNGGFEQSTLVPGKEDNLVMDNSHES